MAPQPLGSWDTEHEASIILSALETLLRAAEVGFDLFSVVFAGVREQDPEVGKLKGFHLLTRSEKGCSWGGGLSTLKELNTIAF